MGKENEPEIVIDRENEKKSIIKKVGLVSLGVGTGVAGMIFFPFALAIAAVGGAIGYSAYEGYKYYNKEEPSLPVSKNDPKFEEEEEKRDEVSSEYYSTPPAPTALQQGNVGQMNILETRSVKNL